MAKDNGNGTVTVQKGDTLWGIASKFLGSGSRYQELASINGISNPNRIYVGQIIKLSGTAGSSGGSSAATSNSNYVTITAFGLQSNTDNTLFATWTWGRHTDNTESYAIEWTYDVGDKDSKGNTIWYISTASNSYNADYPNASLQATYSVPANARTVRLRVKPIAKKKTGSNGSEGTPYWTANWCGYQTWTDSTPVATPPTPSAPKIDKFKLTTELDGITIDATHIVFEIYRETENSTYSYDKSSKIAISATKSVSYTCNVEAGGEYKVRCMAYKNNDSSEWSAFSSGASTIPTTPSGITNIKAMSETAVYLEWNKVNTAETYDIEYTTEKRYFDGSDQTTTKTGIEFNHYEISGMESGDEYFFRVRAVNKQGESGWSDIVSIVIGEKPSAPTTWSSTTTVIVGEPLTLYWVHNAVDGSSQKYAELELTFNGIKMEPSITIKNVTDEDEKDKTSKCIVDTKTGVISWTEDDGQHSVSTNYSFNEGVKIQWRVRTAGITNEYSDWSVQRTVDLYAPPTLALSVLGYKSSTNEDGETVIGPGDPINVLTSFPFYIYGLPGPATQTPVGYHLSIKANESYEAVDQIGNTQMINKDAEVYSKYFDVNHSLLVEFTPANIDLENGISYTVTCTVTMNSGLTSEASREFTVSWTDEFYSPNAEVSYDSEKYVTYIKPYCESHKSVYKSVTKNGTKYTVDEAVLDETTIENIYTETGEIVYTGIRNGSTIYYAIVYVNSSGNPIDPTYYRVTNNLGVYTLTSTRLTQTSISNVLTETGDQVLMGIMDGVEVLYAIVDKAELVEDVTLSVYRREFDGGFTEIMTGISNTRQTVTTDPHPALDYARYRIVAISDNTGAVSYYDLPGYPIEEVGVIIQWDEVWTTFDTNIDEELAQPPWSGSLLRIPYNIDVSDSNNPDVSLVNYIGRKRPVSYYGTNLGEKSSWNMVIPKEDRETLYALRRLALWMGDVYVREPSGSGYWANISVSFNQNHCEVTIPVSMSITRVEGGV